MERADNPFNDSSEQRIRDYLSRQGRDIEVIDIERLAGDVSNRQYHRVRFIDGSTSILTLYPEAFEPKESPTVYLQRLSARHPDALLTHANDPRAALAWSRFFTTAGIPVPKIIGADGHRGIIEQEDLGDLRMTERLAALSPDERPALYMKIIDLIVSIQALTPHTRRDMPIAHALAFSRDKFIWELQYFVTHCLASDPERPYTPPAALREDIHRLAHALALRPQVLTHRDLHSRNILCVGEQIYLIDHQDARLGPMTYDLVSLLFDPYEELDAAQRCLLRNHWISKGDIEWTEALEREWRWMAIQRLLKAAGNYGAQLWRGIETFAPPFHRALERARAALGEETSLRQLTQAVTHLLNEGHPTQRMAQPQKYRP